MDSVRVPTPYRSVLTGLRDLADGDAGRLLLAFESAPGYQRVSDLVAIAKEVLPEASDDEVGLLVRALLSLRGQFRGTSAEEIAELVAQSPDLEIRDVAQREQFVARLSGYLKAEAIATTANALDLLTEHERNYSSAHIFTDIRPVFTHDVSERPSGAVIVELLQLETWGRDGSSQHLSIAMDQADLLELQQVVRRALAKTESLQQFLDDSGLPYFQLDERKK